MSERRIVHRALDAIERLGDRLPDPVFIFAWIIGALVVASVICSSLGVTAVNPVDGEVLTAQSLLSPQNIRTLLVEMPKTLTGFAPLGYVLLIMLGAGVAERAGLLSAAIRAHGAREPPRPDHSDGDPPGTVVEPCGRHRVRHSLAPGRRSLRRRGPPSHRGHRRRLRRSGRQLCRAIRSPGSSTP